MLEIADRPATIADQVVVPDRSCVEACRRIRMADPDRETVGHQRIQGLRSRMVVAQSERLEDSPALERGLQPGRAAPGLQFLMLLELRCHLN